MAKYGRLQHTSNVVQNTGCLTAGHRDKIMKDCPLRDARTVAYRAFCLGALLKRAELEITLQNLQDYGIPSDIQQRIFDRYIDLNERLQQWILSEDIYLYVSDHEQNLFMEPPGTWSQRTILQMGWRTEALGMLLWSLQIMDRMQPFDTRFQQERLLQPLDLLTPTIDLIWRAELRPLAELQAMRDQAELWNWRSRATELQRMGVRPPAGVSFAEIIYLTARKAREDGRLPALIDGDFPAFGKPYSQIDEYEYSLASSIADERYFALTWLCEPAIEWERVLIE